MSPAPVLGYVFGLYPTNLYVGFLTGLYSTVRLFLKYPIPKLLNLISIPVVIFWLNSLTDTGASTATCDCTNSMDSNSGTPVAGACSTVIVTEAGSPVMPNSSAIE